MHEQIERADIGSDGRRTDDPISNDLPEQFAVDPHRRPIKKVQVVIPLHNEAENIKSVALDVLTALSGSGYVPNLLLVDDGSTDSSKEIIVGLSHLEADIRYLCLSRNFGKETALLAGIRECGDDFDALAYLDADGQHSTKDLLRLIDVANATGADVVCGVRTDRSYQTPLQREMSSGFYRLFRRMSEHDIDPGAGDFNVLRFGAVKALRRLEEPHPFMKGLISWIGFKRELVPITIEDRKGGHAKSSTRRMIKLALGAIMSFSSWPLRLSSLVGATVAAAAFLYLLAVILQTIIWGIKLPGYATIVVLVLGLGGFQLLSIGVLGEYVARIYDSSKKRPLYIVSERSE